MFVGDEVQIGVSFPVAKERLAGLAAAGFLSSASRSVYDGTSTGLLRVGAAGLSKLVRIQVRELAGDGGSAAMAIRWEATGPSGTLFPVLDADIRLIPAGDQATVVTMTGSYRPPLGKVGQALDWAVLHRIAVATVSDFVAQVAREIAREGFPGIAEADHRSLRRNGS